MKTKLSVFCQRIIEAGWLAVVLTVPLYFNIYSARTFEPDKITLLRSIVGIMLLAWLVLVAEQGSSASGEPSLPLAERFRRWIKIPLFLPTLLLGIAYVISTLFSISPLVSIWGSYQRLQGLYSSLTYMVVFALVAGNLHTREQVDRLVTTVIIGSIPVGLYGIVQKYGLDPLPWAGDVTTRVAANMGNAIFVASYLIMVIPLSFSRLVESMTAIIREEKASWGHTVLAAIYIFAIAVQIIAVLFTQSRGPMLGILGGSFVMGLLFLLILRRLDTHQPALSLKETGLGLAFILPLGLAGAAGGGIGYLVGRVGEALFGLEGIGLIGAFLGGLLGFFGLYVYMATAGKGWRWLWASWFGIAILGIIFVILLNVRGTPLDIYLDPIRGLPYMGRLAQVIETEGTGKVRILIWDGAQQLVWPHEPLGIPGDDLAEPDRFNILRPLIGYGPESMFNAFALVYPPELAHVESRGSSADRSHNETMDSLVITGLAGFLAFYFLMISLFYYALSWLGWIPAGAARWRFIILTVVSGIVGAFIPYLVQGRFTFMPLGLPFGLLVGVVFYLVWQGLRQSNEAGEARFKSSGDYLLLIGLVGALIGHFIEVHFVFSIAATYTYFWVYAGLMVALARLQEAEQVVSPVLAESEPQESEPEVRRSKKGRVRRKKSAAGPRPGYALSGPESWEVRMGSLGLVMGIILIILVFDFVTPQFSFSFSDRNSLSLLWMFVITWGIGLAIALSSLAIWRQQVDDPPLAGPVLLRAVALYVFTSVSYFFLFALVHSFQFGRRISVASLEDVLKAANVLTNALVIFYLFLLLLMLLLAVMLSWGRMRGLLAWRSDNWWLYPPLVLAVLAVIWFKNINVVRADMYLKEGDRYRSSAQWDQAAYLHDAGRSLDSDEDFYYLMLALDHQLMAQDANIDPARRQTAWQEGERVALLAREINPYNPDNTGNMGRYYFTMAQVVDSTRFQDALLFFEKATILAPSNVVYHNLWAQTHYILQNYQAAIDRLEISAELDERYAPTWILLGDTYAAMSNVDEALKAHRQAIKLSDEIFDQFLDQRLSFYISAGRLEDLLVTMEEAAQARPDSTALRWAIGRAYNVAGQPQNAADFLEQARALGDESDRITRELAKAYFSLNSLDQALAAYQFILRNNPNDVEAHSALAFIYAQQDRPDEAIQHNQAVLQQVPNDYDSLKNLAILYQQKGQWQEALNAAQQAQAVAPPADAGSWEQFITDLQGRLAPPG